MQFTSIIATLSMVLAATAAPSPNPPSSSCASGQTLACCNTAAGVNLLGLDCLLSVATCGLLNQQTACCQTNQAGLIDVALPCQLL